MVKKHAELIGVICLSVLLSFTLLYFRVYLSGTRTFLFFVWNLFLAAIPLLFSSMLIALESKTRSRIILGGLFVGWLLFFPNAPYILTDLFHLRKRVNIPLWYDLILITSFAWNGLFLGFLSLKQIQIFVQKRIGVITGWICVIGSLGLSSFGIYLGRYLRWNSWDVLSQPEGLFFDIADRLLNPGAHPKTFGVTILFTAFLLIVYLTFNVLMKPDREDGVQRG
ncbi:MAG: DUF1361 domain-containing protein [Calditrichia bacterium]